MRVRNVRSATLIHLPQHAYALCLCASPAHHPHSRVRRFVGWRELLACSWSSRQSVSLRRSLSECPRVCERAFSVSACVCVCLTFILAVHTTRTQRTVRRLTYFTAHNTHGSETKTIIRRCVADTRLSQPARPPSDHQPNFRCL